MRVIDTVDVPAPHSPWTFHFGLYAEKTAMYLSFPKAHVRRNCLLSQTTCPSTSLAQASPLIENFVSLSVTTRGYGASSGASSNCSSIRSSALAVSHVIVTI